MTRKRASEGGPAGDPADLRRWLEVLAQEARSSLPGPVLEYVLTGARSGVTAGEAEAAWSRYRLVPRSLRDVTRVDLGTRHADGSLAPPWGVAPTTLQREIHPDGELAVARACAEAGVPMVVSSNAGVPFAEIGRTGAAWWLQVYLPADRTLAVPLLERAVSAGARAVVLTADTPVVGTKYAAGERVVWDDVDPAAVRVNFEPGYQDAPGSEKATDLGPHDIAWLGATTGLPVVVKGVLHPDDAVRAVQAGAAGVWISNHGGRQLDRVRSTAASVAEVAAATRSAPMGDGPAGSGSAPGPAVEVPVLVDGGLRSGLDILTAFALGADTVLLGRPVLLALTRGEQGVRSLLTRLEEEVTEALRLAGCRTPREARALPLDPA